MLTAQEALTLIQSGFSADDIRELINAQADPPADPPADSRISALEKKLDYLIARSNLAAVRQSRNQQSAETVDDIIAGFIRPKKEKEDK